MRTKMYGDWRLHLASALHPARQSKAKFSFYFSFLFLGCFQKHTFIGKLGSKLPMLLFFFFFNEMSAYVLGLKQCLPYPKKNNVYM